MTAGNSWKDLTISFPSDRKDHEGLAEALGQRSPVGLPSVGLIPLTVLSRTPEARGRRDERCPKGATDTPGAGFPGVGPCHLFQFSACWPPSPAWPHCSDSLSPAPWDEPHWKLPFVPPIPHPSPPALSPRTDHLPYGICRPERGLHTAGW